MLIETRFKIQLEISDIAVIYSTNIDEQLIKILQKKYNGKCFKNTYIIDITKIIDKSPLISNTDRTGGSFNIDIDFLAKCKIYEIGEIIPMAEILEISESGMIFLKTDGVSIGIYPQKGLQELKIKDKIPVIVNDLKYPPMTENIVVAAKPFIPINEPIIWHNIIIKSGDIPKLKKEDLKKEDKKYDKIYDLLYPITNTITLPKYIKKVNLSELNIDTSYRICQPAWLQPYEILIFDKEPKKEFELNKPIHNPVIIQMMINSSIKKERLVAQLAEFYKFDKSDKHIWQIYINNKYKLSSEVFGGNVEDFENEDSNYATKEATEPVSLVSEK
jgi:hypothetical protein